MKLDPQLVACTMGIYGCLGAVVGWGIGVWPYGWRVAAVVAVVIAVSGGVGSFIMIRS